MTNMQPVVGGVSEKHCRHIVGMMKLLRTELDRNLDADLAARLDVAHE